MHTQIVLIAALTATAALGCSSNPPRTSDSGVPADSGPGTDSGPGDSATADSGPGDSGTGDTGPACVDGDSDGYGDNCDLGPDCDDGDMSISPAAMEVCDGVDNDCDTMTDEDITAPTCRLTVGVCAGAVARCGASGFTECDGTDYGGDYEADETACDGMDNDCDGTTDEGCTCTPGMTQPCGSDIGLCMAGTQTCDSAASWGLCASETGPMGEVCDGDDNDCDGTADEAGDLVAPDCPLQQGVCSGTKRA
ncbi:MAG: putative metal-binding motif-containing protein, partial [Deltaproteobacteria bacterium]|nr:putative metal-binding motif-containing protein [Deltaproteobacteria bacterium]